MQKTICYSDFCEKSSGDDNVGNGNVKESNLFDVLKILRESKQKKSNSIDEKYKRFSMNNLEDLKKSPLLNLTQFSKPANEENVKKKSKLTKSK